MKNTGMLTLRLYFVKKKSIIVLFHLNAPTSGNPVGGGGEVRSRGGDFGQFPEGGIAYIHQM